MSGIHQTQFLDRQNQAYIGELAFANNLAYLWTLVNKDPQAKQTHTFTVSGATDDTPYTVTINGVDITIDSGTGATTTTIATALAAAINANPYVRGSVEASSLAAVVTVTSLWPGISFTASEADSNITNAAGTANAVATDIKVGRLMVGSIWNIEADTQLGHVARASSMSAQVREWTYGTYEAGVDITAYIEIGGEKYVFTVTSASNGPATVAALAAAINGGMPANTVVAAVPSGAILTLTAEIAGMAFDATVANAEAFTTGAFGETFAATVARGPLTDFFFDAGVTVRQGDEEVDADGELHYPANAGARVVKDGHIWVANSEVVDASSPVYVYVGATEANQGQFYSSAGTDRVLVPRSKARWCYNDRSGAAALLAVNFK